MRRRQKIIRFAYPAIALSFGAYCVITKRVYYSASGPLLEGGVVVTTGVVLLLFGIWGVIGTVQELRKEAAHADSDRTIATPDQ